MAKSSIDTPDVSEESLFRVASSCLHGVRALGIDFNSQLIIPFGIVAGQCLEAAIKCHLLQVGRSHGDVRSIGHDLLIGWQEAAQSGDPFRQPVPTWVQVLNAGHARPYLFRYLPHQYGVSVPNPEEIVPVLAETIEILRKRCKFVV
jgi:hypothetical protein